MEEPFKKTYPAGRSIASLFAKVGWGIVLIGVLLALAGALRGATPGTAVPVDAVSIVARIAAMGVGLGVMLFGLFSVMMAAQTRAAMDTADMTREMLGLARKRPADNARPAAPVAVAEPRPIAAAKPDPVAVAEEEPILDDVPPMPTILRPRPVTLSATKAEPVAAPKAEPALRAEPSLGPRPKTEPVPERKPHPIFSAKPPH
ncbi:hypothetical protein [Jannaschia pohangensis]|uniref:Uncharacterized protein n=1 Tax=Jannaschia pohangensis TaxID=390807 RepID=A0A1I3T692_9RHOB|nr:hypothetical protein [Jannaschia pohangensis]SFJ66584.1 hypothetical protein SAMN04488095_3315 [Jannaschia pohangensis]